MPRETFRTNLLHSARTVYDWHARFGALERLVPAWERVRLVSRRLGDSVSPVSDGTRIVMAMKVGPIGVRWHALHEGHEPGVGFRDVQRRGPFKRWVHNHRFVALSEGGCTLEDDVEYELPAGALGRRLAGEDVRAKLARMFAFRHVRTRRDLDRHAVFRDSARMRIGITGASGTIGSALAAYLSTAGHVVIPIRRASKRRADTRAGARSDELGFGHGIAVWDAGKGSVEVGSFDKFDAVIHLAGEPIAAGRWTPSRKAAVRDSRIEGTRALAKLLSEQDSPPKVFLSASGIGYYGDRRDDLLTEDSTLGSGFLAEVAREWEAATEPMTRAATRVAVLRLGVVITTRGGMLRSILPMSRLGLIGRIGSGKQYISWVGLDDCLAAIEHVLHDSSMHGPVNIVAPSPVTQEEFAKALAAAVRRPTLLNIGSSVARTIFGEMGDELLLRGQRVAPKRLSVAGFVFNESTLQQALVWEAGLG
jgi:uncharacterized protein